VVLVAAERIVSVASGADLPVPEQAEIIDASGRYIVPGLMDANVHLCAAFTPELLLEFEGRYEEVIEEAAQVALRAGVTTVFDTWGPLRPLVAVRDRINRGEVTGSRIFLAGNIVGFDGPLSADHFKVGDVLGRDVVDRINGQWEFRVGRELLLLSRDEVGRRVRGYIESSGIDFLKYAATGHINSEFITFSDRVQRAIVEEAHAAGLTAQAHTTTPESLRMEIEAGADLLQHGNVTGPEVIPDETLDVIVDRRLPVAAFANTQTYMKWARAHLDSPVSAGFQTWEKNNRLLIERGARLLLTTDGYISTPRVLEHPQMGEWVRGPEFSMQLGESHFLWMQAVSELGMAPMQVLLSATRHLAEAYDVHAELGTLEPGKRADLLILEADPLEAVGNYRRCAAVMKDGEFVDREGLPVRRVLTAE